MAGIQEQEGVLAVLRWQDMVDCVPVPRVATMAPEPFLRLTQYPLKVSQVDIGSEAVVNRECTVARTH